MITKRNIFLDIPDNLRDEYFEEIFSGDQFKLERIISKGHKSPPDFWYDQDKNEFVMLISGSAEISFENEPAIQLVKGDYLIIPSHKKHRVEKTDPVHPTIWMALHFK
ncbi:MAG: cupin domain-containing protein [Melioribacteraceae bacterium]|jgi:cupin 2 domain-containing protein|nr:cupin domain-containing protein [Melioribacteraceae bacterium]